MSDFTRYYVPHGGGVEDHPSGRLYLREEVDPVVDALRARIRELEAEKKAMVDALYNVELEIAPQEHEQYALNMHEAAPGAVVAALARSNNETAHCCVCGAIVDTRAVEDGGDTDGCQLSDGAWVCSSECWDVDQ